MKNKLIIILLLIFALSIGIFITYVLYTDRMMVQLPVLIQKNPKITFIMGDASYRKNSSDKWELAIVGQVLKFGYEIKTGNNSQMDIHFHGSMAIRVSENSLLKIDEITVRKVLIRLDKGAIYGKFEKLFRDYDINVKTPTAIAAVRGTELGFEITEEEKEIEPVNDKEDKKPSKEEQEKAPEPVPVYVTTVYSLSGITEIHNPKFADENVLLAYQNKLTIREDEPPSNPEKISDDDSLKIRSKLNSIHIEEVLFISDKINFEVGSATILQNSFAELDKIVKILKQKNARIRIEGHTDIQGTSAFNQTLSVKRAQSIKKFLIQRGIEPENLEIAGYGSSKPIADNKTAEGRAMNRRVEFIVID